MNKKCIGCGALLQCDNNLKEGYTRKSDSELCERCFRIKNYGDYKVIVKDNEEFVNILNDINKTKDLVVLVVDVFNINEELINLSKILEDGDAIVIYSNKEIEDASDLRYQVKLEYRNRKK